MTGHICQSIRPINERQERLLQTIRDRGLVLVRLHRDGRALRVTGPGVFLTFDGLEALELSDLGGQSPAPRRRK